MKNLLVTTADERTWDKNKKIIFLGEWCKKYSRKHIWEKLNYSTSSPYGVNIEIKDRDSKLSMRIEKDIISLIRLKLNKIHHVNFDQRMWTLLVGPWARRYSSLMVNRINVLKKCFNENEINEINFILDNKNYLVKKDSQSSVYAFEDKLWNQHLNYEIIKLLDLKKINKNIIKNTRNDLSFKKKYFLFNLKLFFITPIINLLNYLSYFNKLAIVNIYINLYDYIKLNFLLKQFPYYRIQNHNLNFDVPVNNKLREDFINSIIIEDFNNPSISDIAKLILFKTLPICYLEGFKKLNYYKNRTFFPKNPKIIFTSVNCDTDEVFKLWAVSKVLNDTKLAVYQHGSNYGTEKNDNNPSIDEQVSDYFLNWGWKNDNIKYFSTNIINQFNYHNIKKNRNLSNKIYLIENIIRNSYLTHDVHYEFNNYFNEQKKFVSLLKKNILLNLIVKLHSAYPYYYNCEETLRWSDYDSNIKLDIGTTTFKQVVKESKIVIFSYDSTGFLECLAYNIPCLAFWQNNLEHVRDSAKPIYKILENAEILFFSADDIANKVNTVYDDVNSWWFSKEVQLARTQFCKIYANTNNLNLKNIIKKISKI